MGASRLILNSVVSTPVPAEGDRIVARGRVMEAGRTLTVAQSEVFAESGGQEKLVALLTATLMTVAAQEDISD